MPQRMLIDATRPGETRVVVLNGDRVEEFDYETATKTQVKGNIYLAKVTRVEPSLQAAFVEYGGNRHGFLPFSEIHPDYYRIPIADREALLAEEAALKSEPVDDVGYDHDVEPSAIEAPENAGAAARRSEADDDHAGDDHARDDHASDEHPDHEYPRDEYPHDEYHGGDQGDAASDGDGSLAAGEAGETAAEDGNGAEGALAPAQAVEPVQVETEESV